MLKCSRPRKVYKLLLRVKNQEMLSQHHSKLKGKSTIKRKVVYPALRICGFYNSFPSAMTSTKTVCVTHS